VLKGVIGGLRVRAGVGKPGNFPEFICTS